MEAQILIYLMENYENKNELFSFSSLCVFFAL